MFPMVDAVSDSGNRQASPIVHVNETTFQSNSKLKEIYLETVGSIPWNLFANISLIEFVHLKTTATELDALTFASNFRLKLIWISSKSITFLPWNMFENNWKLEAITLKLQLSEIDERTFARNTKLKVLSMNGNRLEFLPRDLFSNNFLLERIHLGGNKLKIIGIDFRNLENVRLINLSNNDCVNSKYFAFSDIDKFQSVIDESCRSQSLDTSYSLQRSF